MSPNGQPTTDLRAHLGRLGESLVARRYADLGYQELARNWRHQLGEVDLIVANQTELVFVEVKTRASDFLSHPLESISESKQEKLRQLAQAWIVERGEPNQQARFDVAGVSLRNDWLTLDIVPDAFE